MNYRCPHDEHLLKPVAEHGGRFYTCPQCNGKLVNVAVLRKDETLSKAITDIWRMVLTDGNDDGVDCPVCKEKMTREPIPGSSSFVDICKPCQMVWLDSGEYDLLPRQHWGEIEPNEKPLTEEQRQAFLNMQLEGNKELHEMKQERDEMMADYRFGGVGYMARSQRAGVITNLLGVIADAFNRNKR